MDFYIGIILIICVIATLIYFKTMFKKIGMHGDDVVTTSINEKSYNLIKRSKAASEKILAEFGPDFETPQEIYERIMKRPKEVNNG